MVACGLGNRVRVAYHSGDTPDKSCGLLQMPQFHAAALNKDCLDVFIPDVCYYILAVLTLSLAH